MSKNFAVIAICLALLCGSALAQDPKTVVANAQKALGDPKSKSRLSLSRTGTRATHDAFRLSASVIKSR